MPHVDFALIGHAESWESAAAVISALRGSALPPIPMQDIKQILPWIPPRVSSRVTVGSSEGFQVNGVYIDAFIPPDSLGIECVCDNLARVCKAARCAIQRGARMVTLGGFSSIMLEGKTVLPSHPDVAFTTGNTLTVALIIKGVERALNLSARDLAELNVLIIGASGDVGSGCARCLARRVKRLLLGARNQERLRRTAFEMQNLGAGVTFDTDLRRLIPDADVVICAASMASSELLLEELPDRAIVCDAGYPKNLSPSVIRRGGAVFFGGMGQASGGIRLDPDLLGIIYPYPVQNIAHGCLLEGVTLAMERRFEPFSRGRGQITPQRVDEIWQIASRHGIGLPPLFNSDGTVEDRISSLPQELAG